MGFCLIVWYFLKDMNIITADKPINWSGFIALFPPFSFLLTKQYGIDI